MAGTAGAASRKLAGPRFYLPTPLVGEDGILSSCLVSSSVDIIFLRFTSGDNIFEELAGIRPEVNASIR